MKLNIFIVSVACFCCLVPPAYGSLLVAKAVAAVGAVKGAALLGAGALAAKGAAVVAAKKALVGGALALGAKALGAGAELAGRLARPAIVRYVPYEPVQIDVRRVPYYRVAEIPRVPYYRFAEVPRAFPTLLADRLSALVSTATSSLAKKAGAASRLLAALSRASVSRAPVVLDQFEAVEQPSFYSVPVVEKDC